MPNYGLYTVDATKYLGPHSVYNWDNTWHRTSARLNSAEFIRTSNESNSKGAVAINDYLTLNGEIIAKSTGGHSVVTEHSFRFGNAVIGEREKCINITKENYNLLVKGTPVEGYAAFD